MNTFFRFLFGSMAGILIGFNGQPVIGAAVICFLACIDLMLDEKRERE